mmetsp:Transcript_26758/g.64881  ORF Transcript_26758/g.64881 Transcript_26758/m.64881 type:complete len:288 (-) Transcript_26758:3283-4146(-)
MPVNLLLSFRRSKTSVSCLSLAWPPDDIPALPLGRRAPWLGSIAESFRCAPRLFGFSRLVLSLRLWTPPCARVLYTPVNVALSVSLSNTLGRFFPTSPDPPCGGFWNLLLRKGNVGVRGRCDDRAFLCWLLGDRIFWNRSPLSTTPNELSVSFGVVGFGVWDCDRTGAGRPESRSHGRDRPVEPNPKPLPRRRVGRPRDALLGLGGRTSGRLGGGGCCCCCCFSLCDHSSREKLIVPERVISAPSMEAGPPRVSADIQGLFWAGLLATPFGGRMRFASVAVSDNRDA